MFSATDMVGTVAFFSGSSGRPNTLNRSKWSRVGSKFWSLISTWPSLIGRCPDSASTSSLWPLPETPAMPTISPDLTLQIEAGDRVAAFVVFGEQAGDLERVAASCGASTRAADGRTTASPIIIAAISRVDSTPTLPPPTLAPRRSTLTSSQNASTSRNLWLIIATVISPRCAMSLQQAEDLIGLARRQHRGRLVENEEALVEIEQLQDFELLLFARRQRRDRPVERHAERHAVEERLQLAPLLAPVDDRRRVGAAGDEILGGGQRGHQREMLIDHADAERLRVARIAHLRLPGRRASARPCRGCRSP